jgi:eamA-like transporter family
MNIDIRYIGLFLFSVFISSVSQVILKKSANRTYASKLQEYLNIPVMLAYTLFFGSSLLTVLAYKFVPLSMGPILEASGYVYVAVLGALFLNEKLSTKKVIGMAAIILGIVLFNI